MPLKEFIDQPIPPTLITPDVTKELGTVGKIEELLDVDSEEDQKAWELLPPVISLVDKAKKGNVDNKAVLETIDKIRDAIGSTEMVSFSARKKGLWSTEGKKLVARQLLLEVYLQELENLVVPAVPVAPERPKEAKLHLLNTLLRSKGIKEIPETFADQISYDSERKRLSEDIERFIMGEMISQLKNVSNQFVVMKDPKFWSSITISTGLLEKPQFTLEEWINSLPSNANFQIAGAEKNTPLLEETIKYLLDLIKWASSECGRAAMLSVYAKPDEFSQKISSDAFVGIPFDRDMLKTMLTRDAGAHASKERKEDYSAFPAFRDVMQEILAITEIPKEAPIDPSDPDFAAKELRLSTYKSSLEMINMWPVGVKQGDGGVATQQSTFDRVVTALEAKYPRKPGSSSPHPVVELAFRLAVAHCRHTGLEEYLDIRPLIVKENPKMQGKTRAVRSMSRLYHMEKWAKYSVEESGTARDPVATEYASRHPAAALPADKLWFVPVNEGGTIKEMSVFDVLKKGLSEHVIDSSDRYPDDPTKIYGDHTRYGLIHYQALFMVGGLKVLPDVDSLVTVEAPNTVTADVDLATKLAKFANKGQTLNPNDRDYFLGRLYGFERLLKKDIKNPKDMTPEDRKIALDSLLFASFNMPKESPTSVVVKDGCDYYWDNTPIKEEIFAELFHNPTTGGDSVPIMSAVRQAIATDGREGKEKFVMTMFWTLVRAELERKSISGHELETRSRQWRENKVDYMVPVETESGDHPYTWAQRVALKLYLDEIQLGFKEKLRNYKLSKQQIDDLFKNVGVEGNDAMRIADLQWILVREPGVLKSHVKALPAIADNGFFRFMAKVMSITQRERGTT